MKDFSSFIKRRRQILRNGLLLLVCFVLISACVNSGKPKMQTENYLIDYTSPVFEKLPQIDDTIRVNRFTIATAYNNNNMIFHPDTYALDSFNYNRWAVNPADMVGDYLLRDLLASRLFHAAFSRYAVDEGRYVVQGGIEDFFLRLDNKNGNVAVVSLEITLKDTKQREATRKILYQKKYRDERLLTEQSPRGYCQAMSFAMQKLSQQIIADIYQGVRSAEKK
jgi:ABC-type uncharacterized transport system auxiliary subunit